MSLLLAVAQSTSQVEVVKQTLQPIVNNVPQTPAAVLQLLQTLGLFGAAALTSLIHQLVVKDKLSGNVQRALVAGYTLVLAALTALLTNHFGTTTPDLSLMLTSFLVALGAALGRYEYLYKAVLSALNVTLPSDSVSTEVIPSSQESHESGEPAVG